MYAHMYVNTRTGCDDHRLFYHSVNRSTLKVFGTSNMQIPISGEYKLKTSHTRTTESYERDCHREDEPSEILLATESILNESLGVISSSQRMPPGWDALDKSSADIVGNIKASTFLAKEWDQVCLSSRVGNLNKIAPINFQS